MQTMPHAERKQPGTKGQEWEAGPEDGSKAMAAMHAPGRTEQGVGLLSVLAGSPWLLHSEQI